MLDLPIFTLLELLIAVEELETPLPVSDSLLMTKESSRWLLERLPLLLVLEALLLSDTRRADEAEDDTLVCLDALVDLGVVSRWKTPLLTGVPSRDDD